MLYHRRLSRDSAHRKAMLRNMLDSLFEHESIQTTWAKAKEVQRIADKVVTLGKRNTEMSRRRAQSHFYRPHEQLPKLFGPIRERYQDREGGYTRVLRISSSRPNQAPMAIVELVDGPRDMRFSLAARAIALAKLDDKPLTLPIAKSIEKISRFRGGIEGVEAELEDLAGRMARVELELREEHELKQARNETVMAGARQLFKVEESTLDAIRRKTGYVPEDVVEKTVLARVRASKAERA